MTREQELRAESRLLIEKADAEMRDQWKSKYPRGVAIRANYLRAHSKECVALAARIADEK
jgi:hypothetical protein